MHGDIGRSTREVMRKRRNRMSEGEGEGKEGRGGEGARDIQGGKAFYACTDNEKCKTPRTKPADLYILKILVS